MSLLTWHVGPWQTHGEYVLPPIGAGLQPSPSESLDVWRATVCAAAARMQADAASAPSFSVLSTHELLMDIQTVAFGHLRSYFSISTEYTSAWT